MTNLKPLHIGLITAMVMMALSLLFFYTLRLPVNGSNQFAIMSVYAIGIIITLLAYKMQYADATFKPLFQQGFKMFIIVTLVMVIYTFVFYKLNPQILEEKIAESNKMIAAAGDHTLKEIEDNANKVRSIFMPMMLSITIFKNIILGALVTVITSALLSKK